MSEGWIPYELQSPPPVLCQFKRTNGAIFLVNPTSFDPAFNVAGLRWELTGIGREELERIGAEDSRTRWMGEYVDMAREALREAGAMQ